MGGGSGSGAGGGGGTYDMHREERPASKLHPSIAAVIERLAKKQTTVSAAEVKFVRDGKAEIQIWLTEKTPAVIAELKRLGLEVLVDAPNSKLVIGRLPIDKLSALSELKFIRFVAPQS